MYTHFPQSFNHLSPTAQANYYRTDYPYPTIFPWLANAVVLLTLVQPVSYCKIKKGLLFVVTVLTMT